MRVPLPTEEECLSYFEKYKVPENIKRHCLKVQEVASFLAERLSQGRRPSPGSVSVDQNFVRCLALLHDLFKMITIKEFGVGFHAGAKITPEQAAFWKEMQEQYPDKYEGEVAYLIFKDKYPQLAHSLLMVSNPRNEHPSWEELIVHYADWRILQEKIVLIEGRMAYLRERYPRPEEMWKEREGKIRAQEQQIFAHLGFAPEELDRKVKEAVASGVAG